MKFFIAIIFLGISYCSYSQVSDSTLATPDNTDSVIIVKEPVLVTKTIYVKNTTEKPVAKVGAWFLSLNATVGTNIDHNNICPTGDCEAYFNKVKSTTHPYIDNSYELSLAYSRSKLYTELGFSYSIYRDKFKNSDTSSHATINKYEYIDISLGSGYWFKKKKSPLSLLLTGGLSASKFLAASGTTWSKQNTYNVVPLTDQVHLFDYSYRVYARAKVLYKLSTRLHAQLGFTYTYDLNSIKTSDLYTRQRNVFSLTAGLMYNF